MIHLAVLKKKINDLFHKIQKSNIFAILFDILKEKVGYRSKNVYIPAVVEQKNVGKRKKEKLEINRIFGIAEIYVQKQDLFIKFHHNRLVKVF